MLALALLAPPPATESIGLVGTSQGVPVKGILTRTVQTDRSLLSTLELTLMPPGQDPIIVRQETHLKSDGQPLRKLQSVVQGTTRTSFAATFDRRDAQWQGPPGMPAFKVPAPATPRFGRGPISGSSPSARKWARSGCTTAL
ncbi:hypothetical protein CCB81_04365 [Armatimonadetes bacterium Uphvl-Ar2]|nr:hypothetical protein CCB81_04365 [Armatimonadetes bacterium Uphvl-Ar2]